jgi:phosphoribosylanthranilate isomerase
MQMVKFMTHRTRIKICGMTRREDVHSAVAAGADALGFNFYPASPRYVNAEQAASLMMQVPPFVNAVGLFVNADPEMVAKIIQSVPISMLQFHGDETIQQCCEIADQARRPFMRAVRVKADMTAADLLEYDRLCRSSSQWFAGLLLDAFVEGYGGGGKVFDWSLIPKELAPRLVLSGGLNAHNATDAVRQVQPFAVDVSSGVESAKGIKDAAKIEAFIQAVRQADAATSR